MAKGRGEAKTNKLFLTVMTVNFFPEESGIPDEREPQALSKGVWSKAKFRFILFHLPPIEKELSGTLFLELVILGLPNSVPTRGPADTSVVGINQPKLWVCV